MIWNLIFDVFDTWFIWYFCTLWCPYCFQWPFQSFIVFSLLMNCNSVLVVLCQLVLQYNTFLLHDRWKQIGVIFITNVCCETADISIKKLCKAVVECYKQWWFRSAEASSSSRVWVLSATIKAWQKHVLRWQSCCVWQEPIKVCVPSCQLCFYNHFPVTRALWLNYIEERKTVCDGQSNIGIAGNLKTVQNLIGFSSVQCL